MGELLEGWLAGWLPLFHVHDLAVSVGFCSVVGLYGHVEHVGHGIPHSVSVGTVGSLVQLCHPLLESRLLGTALLHLLYLVLDLPHTFGSESSWNRFDTTQVGSMSWVLTVFLVTNFTALSSPNSIVGLSWTTPTTAPIT